MLSLQGFLKICHWILLTPAKRADWTKNIKQNVLFFCIFVGENRALEQEQSLAEIPPPWVSCINALKEAFSSLFLPLVYYATFPTTDPPPADVPPYFSKGRYLRKASQDWPSILLLRSLNRQIPLRLSWLTFSSPRGESKGEFGATGSLKTRTELDGFFPYMSSWFNPLEENKNVHLNHCCHEKGGRQLSMA